MRDGVIVPMITYPSESWVWNERQLRRRIMDVESNESQCNKLYMQSKGEGMKREVVIRIKL